MLTIMIEDDICLNCDMGRYIKWGSYKGKQKYRCSNCGAVVTGNNSGGIKKKLDYDVVCAILALHRMGQSLRDIQKILLAHYGKKISTSTICVYINDKEYNYMMSEKEMSLADIVEWLIIEGLLVYYGGVDAERTDRGE